MEEQLKNAEDERTQKVAPSSFTIEEREQILKAQEKVLRKRKALGIEKGSLSKPLGEATGATMQDSSNESTPIAEIVEGTSDGVLLPDKPVPSVMGSTNTESPPPALSMPEKALRPPMNKRKILERLECLERIKSFSRVPRALLRTPEYDGLSANELRIYIGLSSFWNRSSLIVRPGFAALLRRTGKDPDSKSDVRKLKRGISALIRKGLVWRASKACRGHASEYYLATNETDIAFIKQLNEVQGDGTENGT